MSDLLLHASSIQYSFFINYDFNKAFDSLKRGTNTTIGDLATSNVHRVPRNLSRIIKKKRRKRWGEEKGRRKKEDMRVEKREEKKRNKFFFYHTFMEIWERTIYFGLCTLSWIPPPPPKLNSDYTPKRSSGLGPCLFISGFHLREPISPVPKEFLNISKLNYFPPILSVRIW